MELNESQVSEIEAALEKLDTVDPADLPEPAAELADLLGQIIEGLELT